MTIRRSVWLVALVVVVTAVGSAAPAAAQSSLSPRQYYDGTIAWTPHLECITQQVEYITGAFVSYYGTGDVTWPRVGDLYYVRLLFTVVGNECAGGIAPLIEMLLPPNTQYAISTANPVYCYITSPQNVTSQVTSGCPQTYLTGAYGQRFNWPYAVPYGWTLDIRFPVVSSQPLSGIAGNHYVQAAMSPILGAWAFPYQGVFVAPNDLIHYGGFEPGNLSGWGSQTDAGDLYVASWAAMRSSGYGLVANVDDTNGIFVQNDSPTNAGRCRMRFYVNPYNFDPGEAQNHRRARVFLAFDEPSRRVMAVVLRRISNVYAVSVRVRRDDDTQVDTSFFTLSAAPHTIEVDWQRSTAPGANNGTLRLWVDDSLRQTLTGIDNDLANIDFVRMGAMSVKTGASGALLFDEMESRTTTAVGP
jgi:hypothetical protein